MAFSLCVTKVKYISVIGRNDANLLFEGKLVLSEQVHKEYTLWILQHSNAANRLLGTIMLFV